jgi:transposase
MALALTYTQRQELERRIRTRKARAEDVRRARVIVMLADDVPYTVIAQAVACHPSYISRWKQRFEADGLEGLQARYRGQPPRVRTPQLEARILEKTRQAPPTAVRIGVRANWRRSWA